MELKGRGTLAERLVKAAGDDMEREKKRKRGRPPKTYNGATREVLRERLAKGRAVLAQRVRERKEREARAARMLADQEEGAPPFDIVEMVTSEGFLGDKNISPAQVATLKAIYGLPMNAEEMAAFLTMSDGRPPDPLGYTEVTLIIGRGGGKDDKIACNIGVFEAVTFDVRKLSPGEKAIVPIIAQDEEGANIALGYIEGKLRILAEKYPVICGGPILAGGEAKTKGAGSAGAREKDVVGGEIRVRPNVIIRVYPNKKSATRGGSVIAAILDELAHWRTDAKAYNSDVEIQRAVKAGRRAHTPNLRLVKITSPFGEEGVAYEDWKERHKNRKRLVLQAPTWVFNPALSRESLADEEDGDPEAFARERGAQFGRIGGHYITGEMVDACTRPEPKERPPHRERSYFAALDVAFKGDLYAVGIAHLEGEAKVVFDAIWWRQGSKEKPLDDDIVAGEFSDLLNQYGVDRVIGDQFADVPTKKAYQNLGVMFIMEPQSAQSNMIMFKSLRSAMRRRQIELPPDPMVRKDLLSLQTTKLSGGLVRIAAPERAGMHDDIAKVVAILTLKLLPQSNRVNLTEMNKGAVMERSSLSPQPLDEWSADIMSAIL